MSQLPSLQCLFCQHLNPPDADYCINCDGQLNLQPCYQCEAVDLRTATSCYRCGSVFSRAGAHRPAFPFTPALVGKQLAHPASAGLRVQDSGARVRNTRLVYPPPRRQSVDDVPSAHRSAPAAASRRGTTLWALGISLVLILAAVAVYLYRERLAPTARTPVQAQAELVPAQPAPAVPPQPAPRDQAPAPDAETTIRADRPGSDPCAPAVAALGLCNPATQQGRP